MRTPPAFEPASCVLMAEKNELSQLVAPKTRSNGNT